MCKLVSVIIPTYKRPQKVSRAIQSVLNQTYHPIEIVVVDDNGLNSDMGEETAKVVGSFQSDLIKYIRHKKNLNGSAARNTGIANASGSYIAFLDDDDEFLPEKIELQVKELKHAELSFGGVYCGWYVVEKKKTVYKTTNLKNGNLLCDLLLLNNSICGGSTLLLKKSVINDLGGFDSSLIRHQDWEFLIRFFRKYKLKVIQQPLTKINKDDQLNVPNSDDRYEITKNFLQLFQPDIAKLHFSIQNEIYKRHYLSVCKSYLKEHRISDALYLYNKAKEKSKPTYIEQGGLLLNLIDSFLPFKSVIKRIVFLFRYNHKSNK